MVPETLTGHKHDRGLAAARSAQGLSVLELAVRTGLNPRTIERIESGEVFPHPATRRVLSQALNVAEAELFVREENAA